MEIFITKDEKGGTCHLTTDSSASHYGIPVLRIDGEDIDGDFGPADIIGTAPSIIYAAEAVAGWAKQPGRTAEEIKAARSFLRQWPDGPQV